jgi:hypothetical protein
LAKSEIPEPTRFSLFPLGRAVQALGRKLCVELLPA